MILSQQNQYKIKAMSYNKLTSTKSIIKNQQTIDSIFMLVLNSSETYTYDDRQN